MTVMPSAPPRTALVRIAGPGTPWYRTRKGLYLARIAVGVAIVAIWWMAASFRWLPPEILPTPLEVFLAFIELAFTGVFWVNFFQTLGNGMAALGLAIVIGVPLGLVLGLVPAVERTTRFLLDLGRSFPQIALLPVMVLLFGATAQMEIFVILLSVLWPVLLQTIYGSRRMDPVIRDTVSSYRINLWLVFTKVLLPGAAPFTMTGIRVAGSVSILVAMSVELLAWTPGMGSALGRAQIDEAPDIALGYLFWAGFLGLGLNYLFQFIEDKVLVWNARGDQAVNS